MIKLFSVDSLKIGLKGLAVSVVAGLLGFVSYSLAVWLISVVMVFGWLIGLSLIVVNFMIWGKLANVFWKWK